MLSSLRAMRLNSERPDDGKTLDVEYYPKAFDIVQMIHLGNEDVVMSNNQLVLKMDFEAQLAVTFRIEIM